MLTLTLLLLAVLLTLVTRRPGSTVVEPETDSRARALRLLEQAEREAALEDARAWAEERKRRYAALRSAAANLEATAEKRRGDKSLADLANELMERNRAMGVPDGDW